MKRIIPFLVCIVLILGCSNNQDNPNTSESDFTQYVNPFIGTGGSGHTFPGAAYPLGMVQLSPNTGNWEWEYHSGYQYLDSTVRGFAHTHLSGGGNPVLGDILILPFTDEKALEEESVPFSKKQEIAKPGFYAGYLTRDKIQVELSVTPRTGIHRYTFKKAGKGYLLVNLDEVLGRSRTPKSFVNDAWFEIENDSTINGFLRAYVKRVDRKVWFTLRLSKPFKRHFFMDEGMKRKLVLDFQCKKNEPIEIRVAISGVGMESAKNNLRAESSGKSFQDIKENAKSEWNRYLSKIAIEGTLQQKEQFYTSMYHLFIQPNIISDADGIYRGANDSLYREPENGMYSTFAFWDTYRAANPLYSILIPDKTGTFVNSILRHYDEKGYLPVWPLWGQDSRTMIGNHSVPTLVDACLKEIPGIDQEKVYEAVKTTLTKNSWEKYDWTIYDEFGYLPFDKVNSESVSRTLEATYDDWCAARLAKKLGKKDDYIFFMNRSHYYKNLLDPETKMMRGRDSSGNWRQPFNPVQIEHAGTSNGDYTEGNSWQYSWHVQHDVNGLIKLMGGAEAFSAKLDTLFSMHSRIIGEGSTHDVSGHIGQYAHGNEPSQHVAYLYNYAGKPHKTQEMVNKIIHTLYNTSPEGYCGNCDFGQMSAWYIFSSLGFYPISPASGLFDLGAPIHKYAKIDLAGNPFIITANNLTPDNKYVKSVTLNGEPLSDYHLSYSNIMKGGELIFEMTNRIN